MRINYRQSIDTQSLSTYSVSASSRNNIGTHVSNYMVEVGPGLGVTVTILMAVLGAVVVVSAAAAVDR